jgi:uncharacterized protein YabN with tetrapyrrole methylase and pyrophosphatase domain
MTQSSKILSNLVATQQNAIDKGFDFKSLDDALDKLQEEIAELRVAHKSGIQADIMDELGDVLFTAVLLATHLNIDANDCLKQSGEKFTHRFNAMELDLQSKGLDTSKATTEQMVTSWQKIKTE